MTNDRTRAGLRAELLLFVVRGQQRLAVVLEVLDEVYHECGRKGSHGGKRIGTHVSKSRRNQRPEATGQNAEQVTSQKPRVKMGDASRSQKREARRKSAEGPVQRTTMEDKGRRECQGDTLGRELPAIGLQVAVTG